MNQLFYLLCFCFFVSIILSSTFNKLPAAWFCDYGEEVPDVLHQNRINAKLWRIPLTCLLFPSAYWLLKNYSLIESILLFFMFCLLIQISLSDILYMIIPDQHIVAIFISALLLTSLNTAPYTFGQHFIGGFIGGGLYLLISTFSFIYKKVDSLGFGDIKLMAVLGFLVGPQGILFVFVTTTLLSTIFLLLGLVLGKIALNSFIPLAPFISISFLLQILV